MIAAPVLLRPRAYRDSFAAAWRLALRHRELLWELQKRDLSDRYVGSVLGAFWGIAQPLFLMALYTVVFGFFFRLKLESTTAGGLDYPSYLIAGYLPWIAMMDVMSRSSTVIYANINLIKQVAFPTELLPAKGLLGAALPQAVGTLFLLAYVGIRFGHYPTTLCLLPVALLFHCLFALGLGWLLALVGAYFRDTPNMLSVFFQLNLFLMPIVFVPSGTPEILSRVIAFNPFAHLIYVYQDILFYGAIEHPWSWLILAAMSVITFVVGFSLFTRAKQAFGNVL
jgi:lipopolysaccharide transport system permease protein